MFAYIGRQLDTCIVAEGTTEPVYWKAMLAVLGQDDRNPDEEHNAPNTRKHTG